MEWFPQVQRIWSAIQAHYTKSQKPVQYLFSGFSFGAVFASVGSLHTQLSLVFVGCRFGS
jgi:hypothetical protein